MRNCTLRLENSAVLKSLAEKQRWSPVGAQALYVSAVAFENLRGDTLEAENRYIRLEEDFAETEYGELALQRREARSGGTIAKLQRSLKGIGGVLKPGEEIALLALEPDTLDSPTNEGRLYISASDIINGTVDPEKIKNHLLILIFKLQLLHLVGLVWEPQTQLELCM